MYAGPGYTWPPNLCITIGILGFVSSFRSSANLASWNDADLGVRRHHKRSIASHHAIDAELLWGRDLAVADALTFAAPGRCKVDATSQSRLQEFVLFIMSSRNRIHESGNEKRKKKQRLDRAAQTQKGALDKYVVKECQTSAPDQTPEENNDGNICKEDFISKNARRMMLFNRS